MKTWMVLALTAMVGVWGCGDNDNSVPDAAHPSAGVQCEVMGTLCHDSETPVGHACHEHGHAGVAAQCAAEFSGCIAECLGDGTGDVFCRALGSLCHDTTSDEGQACHELGHHDDPDACRERFDGCAETCLASD